LQATVILSPLVKTRAADEVERIKREARALYADAEGGLKLDVVAKPPRLSRARMRDMSNRDLARTASSDLST